MRILLLICLALSPLYAQEASVSTELSSRTAFLGDAVELQIKFRHPKGTLVEKRPFEDAYDEATLLEAVWGEPTQLESTDMMTTDLSLKLSWYRLGEYKIPPFEFEVVSPDMLPQKLETPELTLEIVNMLTEEDQELAPPKDQVALQVPSLTPYLIGLLILLALIAYGFYRYFKGKEKPEEEPVIPAKPPYEEAKESLDALAAGSLLKEGRFKEFYVEINLIIRHFYARLFNIHAEEMTSFELEEWFMDRRNLPDNLVDINRDFQDKCDRVKFAKHDPVQAENKEVINRGYQILSMLKETADESERQRKAAEAAAEEAAKAQAEEEKNVAIS